jgi:hypothetical protein
VQDLERVAVEDGDGLAGEVSNGSGGAKQEQERGERREERAESKDMCSSRPRAWRRDNKTPVR